MSGKNTNNHKRNTLLKVFLFIIVILIILLFVGCRGCKKEEEIAELIPTPTPIAQNEDQSILQRMKDDEKYLFELYDSPNICEKDWVKEYRNIGYTFTNYHNEYNGDNEEISALLKDYIDYGNQIEKIAISIDKSNYEEGVKQLEELKETAKKNEKELQRLYEKEVH